MMGSIPDEKLRKRMKRDSLSRKSALRVIKAEEKDKAKWNILRELYDQDSEDPVIKALLFILEE